MKSPDPTDPQRLEVTEVDVTTSYSVEDKLVITIQLEYEPWWTPISEADILFEKINAITCIREALRRGGVIREY